MFPVPPGLFNEPPLPPPPEPPFPPEPPPPADVIVEKAELLPGLGELGPPPPTSTV